MPTKRPIFLRNEAADAPNSPDRSAGTASDMSPAELLKYSKAKHEHMGAPAATETATAEAMEE